MTYAVLLLAMSMGAAFAGTRTDVAANWLSSVESLPTPASAGSAQPQLNVQGNRTLLS